MSFLGETGVDLLMSDSTNAEVPTFSISEKTVAGQVQEEFRKTEDVLLLQHSHLIYIEYSRL